MVILLLRGVSTHLNHGKKVGVVKRAASFQLKKRDTVFHF